MNFRQFLIESDAKDIKDTIAKLPNKIKDLVDGYTIKFQNGDTLKGDSEHVGFIDEEKKTIILSAPFRYGREFVLLHEIGHIVWKYLLTPKKKKEWSELVKVNPKRLNDEVEENFCQAHACFYSSHRVETYNNPKWMNFVRNI